MRYALALCLLTANDESIAERERISAERKLSRPEHPEHDAVEGPVRAGREQERAEDEDRGEPYAAERPADEPEQAGEREDEQPRLDDVAERDEHAYDASAVVAAVVLSVVFE